MIHIRDEMPNGVIVMEAIGQVTRADYQDTIIPELERAFAFGQKVRFLYILGKQFKGFEPAALIDDARIGIKHLDDFERVAVVCDRPWIKKVLRFLSLISSYPVKTFNQEEEESALRWLKS